MSRHRFTQVDVFTDVALKGNALAVVHDADGLSDATMQAFAHWTNLSETTFLLKPTQPGADYRVRIFTPKGEMRFAGHPTLGSCHAWRLAGGVPATAGMVVQECGVGLVRIRQRGQDAAFAAPPLRVDAADAAMLGAVQAALGLEPEQVVAAAWLDNGARWLVLHLDSAASVLAVEPDMARLEPLAEVGLVGAHAAGGPADFELRAFAPSIGVGEDPVTGSLNASVAQWLMQRGAAPEAYRATQGTRLGRAGRVVIEREGDTVWVGGPSVACIQGELTL
jgi:PhzF family phenazine biosynthesis protein